MHFLISSFTPTTAVINLFTGAHSELFVTFNSFRQNQDDHLKEFRYSAKNTDYRLITADHTPKQKINLYGTSIPPPN